MLACVAPRLAGALGRCAIQAPAANPNRVPRRGMTDLEWPTATTNALWRTIVARLGKHPHVWWGVSNEPQYNFDGAQDAQV